MRRKRKFLRQEELGASGAGESEEPGGVGSGGDVKVEGKEGAATALEGDPGAELGEAKRVAVERVLVAVGEFCAALKTLAEFAGEFAVAGAFGFGDGAEVASDGG